MGDFKRLMKYNDKNIQQIVNYHEGALDINLIFGVNIVFIILFYRYLLKISSLIILWGVIIVDIIILWLIFTLINKMLKDKLGRGFMVWYEIIVIRILFHHRDNYFNRYIDLLFLIVVILFFIFYKREELQINIVYWGGSITFVSFVVRVFPYSNRGMKVWGGIVILILIGLCLYINKVSIVKKIVGMQLVQSFITFLGIGYIISALLLIKVSPLLISTIVVSLSMLIVIVIYHNELNIFESKNFLLSYGSAVSISLLLISIIYIMDEHFKNIYNIIMILILGWASISYLIFSEDTKVIALPVKQELNIGEKQKVAKYKLQLLSCTAISTMLNKIQENFNIIELIKIKLLKSININKKYVHTIGSGIEAVEIFLFIVFILLISIYIPSLYKRIYRSLVTENI